MKTVKILCDNCSKDITDTNEMPMYRLCLSSEAMPSTTSLVCVTLIYPPIEHDLYFCDLTCLQKYINWKLEHE